MEQYFTAKAHSKPKKLNLYLPDGTPTDDYIMVLGVHSKEVREAKTNMYREKLNKDLSFEDAKNIMISAMIHSWNLEKECTEENKLKLLKDAPQIADSIDVFSATHSNFTKK